jgi:regulator of sigma E protease
VGITIASLLSRETRVEQYGVFEAVQKATERCYSLTVITFRLVGKLLTGAMSIRTMSGPIEIARFSGEAAAAGFTALLAFMSLISLQLGIFNLFPIPILDGGVIALLMIEGLIRRDLSLKTKERIFQVGFLFLVLLMSIVILNDISKNV